MANYVLGNGDVDRDHYMSLQDEWYNERYGNSRMVRVMPLSIIPVMSDELYRKSINYKNLEESTKKLVGNKQAGEIELADGFIDFQENSKFSFLEWCNMEKFKKGKWQVFLDSNGLFWRCDGDIDDLIMNAWVEYVLDD